MNLIQVGTTFFSLAQVGSAEYFAPDDDATDAQRTLRINLVGIQKPVVLYGDWADKVYQLIELYSFKVSIEPREYEAPNASTRLDLSDSTGPGLQRHPFRKGKHR